MRSRVRVLFVVPLAVAASLASAQRPTGGELDRTHWAYQPPVRPQLPQVENETWVRTPIDRFVLEALEKSGVAPAPEADRATLARRVSLDLTGLPPTADELDAFLSDDEASAYERYVDRLLASPHYGERWAQHWLDAARYADSHGFTIDDRREMWPYRDWVIAAFNTDMPFDQFTIEQLAGDLLPEPSEEQLVATGFHRNTMTNQEGGADDEEFRVVAVKDRVDTTATVWLGTTMACAQCHDHKYDPFSITDYYRLYAFFDQTQDTGTRVGPTLPIYRPDQRAELDGIEAEIAELRQRMDTATPELEQAQAQWERDVEAGRTGWQPIDPLEVTGARLEELGDGSLRLLDRELEKATYELATTVGPSGASGLLLEVIGDPELPQGGPGNADNGNFVLTGLEVSVRRRDASGADGAYERVGLTDPRASYFQNRSLASYYPIVGAIDDDELTGWAILPRTGQSHRATFALERTVEAGSQMRIRIAQEYGHRHLIGRLRLSLTDAAPPYVPTAVGEARVAAILERPADERSAEELEQVAAYYRSIAPSLKAERDRIAELKRARPKPTSTLVMREVDELRPTRVMKRGSFLDHGPPVSPGVPEVLPPLRSVESDGMARPTRLDLARWLVRPDNPLTARVTVNRWWQRFFGFGLVETENDFGTRSRPPSHPELLDWLATELVESGYGVKAMHRQIVLSSTYRQSSFRRPELEVADPRNLWLARQNRLRLDAEAIRDSALVASGLLERQVGGAPVFPPQAEGVYLFTQKVKNWVASTGPDRYRRTLYTWIWRTSPHPFLTTFDAPDPAFTCTRRHSSNTPLQALTLANDPMMLELARGLAARALKATFADEDQRLGAMFRWSVGRPPEVRELELLSSFLAQQREAYARSPEAAQVLRAAPAPDDVADERAAAWIATARVLLNLDEFVTRG